MIPTSTLYIDESGKSSLAETENEPFLIVGVILDNEEVAAVEGFFNYIKRKYHISAKFPFHSYDVYENPKSKLSDNELLALSKNLAEYLSLIPVQIDIIALSNKSEFNNALGIRSAQDFKGDKKRKEMKDFPYRVMASYLFATFAKYLEKQDRIGGILADSRRGGDHQLLKTLHLCKENNIPFNKGYIKPLKEKINAISFAEKGYLSGGLEITDLISYTSFFRARRLLSSVKNQGIDLIWEVIREKAKFRILKEDSIRKFFKIKKDEVYKCLKN